jgi:peptidyl-prolyl cis-trans isomerase D
MSIIQSIREKAAWLVFGIIGLSLIGFLLMDAFQGGGGQGVFAGDNTVVGNINGKKLDYVDYEKRRSSLEEQYKASGYPVNEMTQQNIQEQVWGQFVEETVLEEEYEALGLVVTEKEFNDILFGANPPQDLRQQFTNPQTGEYDANGAKAAIANLRKQRDNPAARQFEEMYLPALISNRLREKYTALLANSAYVPKWMLEKMAADNAAIASMSYVNVPYTTISDSAVQVTDADINQYVGKHTEEFKQPESRSISYVVFDAAPSQADSQALYNQMANLKAEFETTTDVPAFLVRNGSETPLYEGYVLKSKMQVPNTDSIQQLQVGQVFGPYLDNTNYVLARMLDKRSLPDSVKTRHILISTQTGIADSTAKARIDSIAAAIRGGANFAALALQYSDDPGSKENGGEYNFGSEQMGTLAKEFADVVFYGNTGDKKVVKTSFGYHYIEVLNQKNFEQAYKVAYLSKPITPSQDTENRASGLANQFSGESRDAKAFEANLNKYKYTKLLGTDIKPIDNMLPGLGSARPLVRWIYEADLGDVSEPYLVGDKYVVAVVTEINEEGTMPASKARMQVEYIIRNQKKAEQIKNKIGKANTLESVASTMGLQVQRADSVSFASGIIPNVGQEPKVIGGCFNKAWLNKVSPPIAGNGGVFVIRPENISAAANVAANTEEQRTAMLMRMKSMSGYRSIDALKKAAEIKDYRAKFL